MPCTDTENTPLPGDTENVLLRKLLNRLCNVTSGGGGGVSQAYVDARDAATLASANATAAVGDAATLAAALASASGLYVLKAGDTMTGALLQPAGSVGAPALSRSGDTDTGLWYPAANTWAISTAGAERLRILSTGEVGIGTTTPGQLLTINGGTGGLPASSGTTQTGAFRISGGADPGLDVGVYGATGATWLQATNKAALGTNHAILLNPNGGNVGIGIAVPLAKLHITPAASGTDYFRIDHSDGTPRLQVGRYSAGSAEFGAIWLGGIVPGDTNYTLISQGVDTYLNAPGIGGTINFQIQNVATWRISNSGHFLAATDNTYDIGASGATRPRNVYVAGKVTIGSATALITSSVAMNDGAAAALGTLTNAPAAGNPTKWIPIDDNGTTRYIPTW